MSWWDAPAVLAQASQYEDALRIDPALSAAYYGIGLASQEMGDLSAAKTAFDQALTLNPDCTACTEARTELAP